MDSAFAKGLLEMGYKSADNTITKADFEKRIKGYTAPANLFPADDTMFGVNLDFLYNRDTGAFTWDFCKFELEFGYDVLTYVNTSEEDYDRFNDSEKDYNKLLRQLKNEGKTKELENLKLCYDSMTEYLMKALEKTIPENQKDIEELKAKIFNEFKVKFGFNKAFTSHDLELYAAETLKKKSTCQMKGWYDACSAVLNGFEYDYDTKSIDKQIFDSIIEMKSTIFNNATRKNEAHYRYYYFFEESQFSLMRSNSNYLIKKVVDGSIANGKIYATKEIANANAIKLSNFIGNLLYTDFHDIAADAVIIDDNASMTDEAFFRVVTEQSGLDDVLQAHWVRATNFNVKDIMSALGVSVKDEVILDVELTKGTYMGARILTDIYRSFVDSPVGYIARLFQLFSRNYDALYSKAIQALFSTKFDAVADRTRQPGDSVDSYDGFELSSFDGFINFIADSIYFDKIDSGKTAYNFTFAPLPIVRLATAKDIDELYLYLLCYCDINRSYASPKTDAKGNIVSYESNAAAITDFLTKAETAMNTYHTGETKSSDITNVMTVLTDAFTSTLVFPKIQAFYIGTIAGDVITSFPNNFMSNIKNAIANLINSFIRAMDNFMNLLFGWTDGLFDKNK
jgi:hypothetical protein